MADLEIEPQHDLPAAWTGADTRRNAEVINWRARAGRGPEWNAAKSEVRAVEDVEEFTAQLDVDRLGDARAFDEPHVVVVVVGIAQFIDVNRRALSTKPGGKQPYRNLCGYK